MVRFRYGGSTGNVILAITPITPITIGPQAVVADRRPGRGCSPPLINGRSVEMEFTNQFDQFVQSGDAPDAERRRIDACLLHCAFGLEEFPGTGPAPDSFRRVAGDMARLDQR